VLISVQKGAVIYQSSKNTILIPCTIYSETEINVLEKMLEFIIYNVFAVVGD
jgi:hypothetical protein